MILRRRFELVVIGAGILAGIRAYGEAPASGRTSQSASPSVDSLLGKSGRRDHQQRLAAMEYTGNRYPWSVYSDWGKELFFAGQVAKPPIGSAPSKPISEFYRCVHCHNAEREDLVLTSQDPDARFFLVTKSSSKQSEHPLFLASGVTMWGAVNRESFYNDSYAVYHSLEVPGGRAMNPTSLEDAVQVCCGFCSVGRYAEPWEIAALLAFLWDRELRLDDLDLPPAIAEAVRKTLEGPAGGDSDQIAKTRQFLRRQFLTRSGDQYTAPPAGLAEMLVGKYPDHVQFTGNAKIGKQLYAAACLHCHGEGKPNEREGNSLVSDLKRFHQMLSKGTSRDDEAYMPMFTRQRLSRRQIIDIQVYLQTLK